jgi:hypothetical protein
LGKLGDLMLSPDGKMIALTEGKTLIWLNATTGEEIGSVDFNDYGLWGRHSAQMGVGLS